MQIEISERLVNLIEEFNSHPESRQRAINLAATLTAEFYNQKPQAGDTVWQGRAGRFWNRNRAKYPGFCQVCIKNYEAGDTVWLCVGEKPRCLDCPPPVEDMSPGEQALLRLKNKN